MAKQSTTPHFSGFSELMEQLILPHHQAHPDFERLDGLAGIGNQKVFANFFHFHKKWRVNSDTKVAPLLAAWETHQALEEPFVEESSRGNRPCLRLNNGDARAKGLYIYLVVNSH